VLANTNVCIIEGRPMLPKVIPNIIFGNEVSLSNLSTHKIEKSEPFFLTYGFPSVRIRPARTICTD
jgi:hypothetical protein